jgi:FAD/FMN-containing dehydrogenase
MTNVDSALLPLDEACDFSRAVLRNPARVASVETAEQIVRALGEAEHYGHGARVRGGGGSCGGQTLTEGGWVLSLRSSGRIASARDLPASVRVPAGATWAAVRAALAPRGLDVPVLTSNLMSTVGGTLSVGGYGAHSVSLGAQIEHVQALTIVTPTQQILTCSRAVEPEVFRFVLGGMGTLGVIADATMAVRSVPIRTESCLLDFPTVEEAMDGLVKATCSVDPPDAALSFTSLRGALPPQIRLLLGYEGRPVPESLAAIGSHRSLEDLSSALYKDVSHWLAPYSSHRRLWADYVISASHAVAFAGEVMALLRTRPEVLDSLAGIYLLALRTQGQDHFPLAAHLLEHAPREAFGLGLYFMAGPSISPGEAAIREILDEVLTACIAHGGRPYRCGLHELSAKDERRIYGDETLSRYRILKHRLDPNGVLPTFFH